MSYINDRDWLALREEFNAGQPFKHIVIDDFFNETTLRRLLAEFPDSYDSDQWSARYDNPLEHKRTCNHWDAFPETTYKVFSYLNSAEFIKKIEAITGIKNISPDVGLHGGGWHAHQRGGKLNVHLDYSIHPKLKLERHYNLIVYITPGWQANWGGGLGLWSHDATTHQPRECVKMIENVFNRAVLFDTTQNSWHGLPEELQCPDWALRRSLAVYYLTEPSKQANPRNRALFAPTAEQCNDLEIVEFAKKRSQL